MAVHIRLVKNNIKNNNSYGKYFAKAVSQGEVTMKELAEEAALNSGISRANFIRGVAELQDMMKHRLANGQTVVIEGIGNSLISVGISPASSVSSCLQVNVSTLAMVPRTVKSSMTSLKT